MTVTSYCPYSNVTIDISGHCNAKCRYCITGINNRSTVVKQHDYIPLTEFKEIISHLLSKGIVNNDAIFTLYNWGEPFLNPEMKSIIEFMNAVRLHYAISTNASIYPSWLEDDYRIFSNCHGFIFSCCGFSQESYNRINGLIFKKVLDNIHRLSRLLHLCGVANISMSYHIYQFNYDEELCAAEKFCRLHNIKFNPYYARLNDPYRSARYISRNMSRDELYDVSENLFSYYIPDILKKRPLNYRCPQLDMLVIDEHGDVLPCCGVIEEKLGNIMDLTLLEVIQHKENAQSCKKCRAIGGDYFGNAIVKPKRSNYSSLNEYLRDISVKQLFDVNRPTVLYGCGVDGENALRKLTDKGVSFAFAVDKKNYGKNFFALSVKNPSEIKEYKDRPFIIIGSSDYATEITDILIDYGYRPYVDFCHYSDLY